MERRDYIETHTKKDNIKGIDTIIEILQNIKNGKDIEKYKLAAEIKTYCMRDHTKGPFVKTSKIGSKIEIVISEGILSDIDKTSWGHFITNEE